MRMKLEDGIRRGYSRRRLLSATAGLGALWLAGCGSGSNSGGSSSAPAGNATQTGGAATAAATQAKSLGKITVSQPSNSLGFSPVIIADKKGYFTSSGLQSEIVLGGSGSKAAAAVIGGSAQVGSSSLSDPIGAIEKGQNIKVFTILTVGVPGLIVLKKSIADKLNLTDKTPLQQRVQALKGLKISISTPGSGTDTALRYILSKFGLNPERDVQILTTGSVVNSQAAFAQGAADATSLSSPNAEEAVLQSGGFTLVNIGGNTDPELSSLSQVLNGGLWATNDWLDKHPDQATATVVALWKSLDYIQSSPADAAETVRVAAWNDLDKNVFETAWKNNLASFPKTPAVTTTGLKALIDYTALTDKEAGKLTPDQVGTNKYVELAQKQMGH